MRSPAARSPPSATPAGRHPELAAFRATLDELHGAYAILLISETAPGRIFFARQVSPLQLGFAAEGCYFASSDAPLVGLCAQTLYLDDGHWGLATATGLSLFSADGQPAELAPKPLPATSLAALRPIALADAELFTIALMARSTLYDKVKSNVEALSARDATIIAITTEYFELADDIIQIRAYDHPMLEFFEMLVVVQLLAMEIAIRLGNDVDMPRNLAKSVTVE
ncbi:hypothetical protein [Halochromatium roseum]|uniref:hypothetical protein n=1 Tax=Halochromatium roseum TaxID=391920 RepID=UPI001914824C|nr:hypothetical protein [Halochromatium roseum]